MSVRVRMLKEVPEVLWVVLARWAKEGNPKCG